MSEFDFSSAYKVQGQDGIAWRVTGYATTMTDEDWLWIGGDEDDPEDESNYIYCEPEEMQDTSRVVAHMIGDDRDFTFEVDELTPITEDEYCSCCGQIGCGWG